MNLTPRRVLVVGAHPDDIELGCLGTLIRWRVPTRVVILTQGGLGGGGDRAAESRAAFAEAGLTDCHIHDLPDAHLAYQLPQATGLIEEHLREFQPSLVLTQTEWDTHPDHRAVKDIVFAATRRQPISIIGYHIISSTQAFPVNMVVDVGEVLGKKLRCLAHHRSQTGKGYFDTEYLKEWHKEKTATGVGITYAELFHIYRTFQ